MAKLDKVHELAEKLKLAGKLGIGYSFSPDSATALGEMIDALTNRINQLERVIWSRWGLPSGWKTYAVGVAVGFAVGLIL